MHYSLHDTSNNQHSIDAKQDIEFLQGSVPTAWLQKGGGASIIGSIMSIQELVDLYPRRLGMPALGITSFSRPVDYLLANALVVYVLDIDDPRRLRQLEECCKYRRDKDARFIVWGLARFVVGLSRADRSMAKLEKVVTDLGARFQPLFG